MGSVSKCMTESKIVSDKFKIIDESFYKEAAECYLQVEIKIKDIIRLMCNQPSLGLIISPLTFRFAYKVTCPDR